MTKENAEKKSEMMKAKQLNKFNKVIVKRVKSITHVKQISDYNTNDVIFLINECKDFTQAKTIDFLLMRKVSTNDVIQVLSVNHYNNDDKKAYARLKRHANNDKSSRVTKRNT